MKKVLSVVFAAFVCQALFVAGAFAQTKEKKVFDDKKQVIQNTRGADVNIKAPKPSDDKVMPPKPTPSRGDVCTTYINNYTAYTIDIYVDGNYKGSVAAYGDGYTYAVSGTTKLYAKSIGGTVYWGPRTVDCQFSHTWNLKD
ncbi:MAG: hypothetical protein NTX64_11310 [Elusimicrobia bacterium]|nr:hypothetical protein [Elusimicrobiota bacterium]